MTAVALIIFSLVVLYWILNFVMYRIPEVEAGPTKGLNGTGTKRVNGRIQTVFKHKESDGSVTLYRRFIVKGKCMQPANIREGSLVNVRMITKKELQSSSSVIKENDIVLIHLNDKNFRGYKLRIVSKVEGDKAITFYYNGTEKKESSKPHPISTIIGVVAVS